MPRTPPPRTEAQQQEHERRRVLIDLDMDAARAWGLLGDDRAALISMHEARAIDPAMPRQVKQESIAWLKQEYPASTALKQRKPGPRYGRAKL